MQRLIIPLLVCLIIVAASGCRLRSRSPDAQYDRPLAPGAVALQELSVSEFPRFTVDSDDRPGLRKAIAHSLKYLSAPSAAQHFPIGGITQAQTRAGLELLDQLLTSGADDRTINQMIRERLRVFRSIGFDNRGTVLFTGYYTPIFRASRERGGPYQYPLYQRPADLVSGPDGKTIAQQRLADGKLRPYPDRRALETSGVLDGLELVYLADPFEAYVVQVQGSGFLRLPDGGQIEVGYDGTNGHEYRSVGKELIKDGRLDASELSLDKLRDFFRRHPELVAPYLHRNPRYIFFTETKGGPYGSLGQAVTADASIATDKSIFPRAALCWISTELADPRPRSYGGFRLDQDTGGAIRAPGRCDIYMGVGTAAELRAGRQLAEGQLLYLVGK
jgi:membrane-bound lytic murein transglycosylase A